MFTKINLRGILEFWTRSKGPVFLDVVDQVDLVLDASRKALAKEKPEKQKEKKEGVRLVTKIKTYKNFKEVKDLKKTKLFTMAANPLVHQYKNIPGTLALLRLENVLNNHEIENQNLQPCLKREDGRGSLHAQEQWGLGYKKLLIVTVKANVIVTALYVYWDLDVDELKVEFGKKRLLMAYNPFNCTRSWLRNLQSCYVLVCSHEIWVFQFLGRSKVTAWNTWGWFPWS